MVVREFKRVVDLPVVIEPDILYIQKSPSLGVRVLLKSKTSNKLSVFGRTVWLKGDAVVPYTPSVQGAPRELSVYTLLNFAALLITTSLWISPTVFPWLKDSV